MTNDISYSDTDIDIPYTYRVDIETTLLCFNLLDVGRDMAMIRLGQVVAYLDALTLIDINSVVYTLSDGYVTVQFVYICHPLIILSQLEYLR